jgi:hypothetical protein
MAPRKRK